MRTYSCDGVEVKAFKRGGYCVLRINERKDVITATRQRNNPAVTAIWCASEKKFEDAQQANKYFLGIKKRRPELVMTADEPDKYISHDGTVKTY